MKKKDLQYSPPAAKPEDELKSVDEIAGLLDEVFLEEANNEVWQRFEQALGRFDAESLTLFEQYLEGATIEELSKEKQLSEEQITAWITHLKRALIHGLKEGVSVRQ